MISHQHKCIFIHIPKTAGTSISKFYFPRRGLDWKKPNYDLLYGWCPKRNIHLQHATSKQLLEFELVKPEVWKSYFKFTFVRNPYDRAYSDYFWIMKDRGVKGSFSDYINKIGEFEKVLKDNSEMTYRGEHLIPQTDFFDFEGEYKLDIIGRFENLKESISNINNQLRVQGSLNNHAQKGNYKKSHYSHFYDDEKKAYIDELFKNDLEKLNYKFEKQFKLFKYIEKFVR